MSFMKGDLLTKTRKLVKGLMKAKPLWLKAMEEYKSTCYISRTNGKSERISLPEDVYVKKFFQKHPDSLHEDPIRFSGTDPPPARIFSVGGFLKLKEQGVNEEEAMAVADEGKEGCLQKAEGNCTLQGEKPPNPYPSAIKEIQAEERKYVMERFNDPSILEIVQRLKEEGLLSCKKEEKQVVGDLSLEDCYLTTTTISYIC
ncbi:hypothetical protein MKW92_028849 [Papaver armeniacum]|nr:hypothetical protein MKW92_028849 [Papaver armeniacum]